MSDSPETKDLRLSLKARFDQFPGGFAAIRTEWQNAATVAALKTVLGKIFQVILGL